MDVKSFCLVCLGVHNKLNGLVGWGQKSKKSQKYSHKLLSIRLHKALEIFTILEQWLNLIMRSYLTSDKVSTALMTSHYCIDSLIVSW